MEDSLLKAEGIRKSYNELEILKGLDLTVPYNKVISVIGKSGSGKSTMLNVLALLDGKDGGKIYIEGKDSDNFSSRDLVSLRRNTISFVFQNSLLFADFSALENIMLTLSIAGFERKKAREKAEEVLHLVGLGERMDHRPNALSGGERQRVAVARAIATESRLIFFDEPTGSLDEESKKGLESILFSKDILGSRSALIVTHDLDLARRADICYVLKGGKLEEI